MGAIAGTARSYKGLVVCRSAPWARSRAWPAPTRDWQCVGAPHGRDQSSDFYSFTLQTPIALLSLLQQHRAGGEKPKHSPERHGRNATRPVQRKESHLPCIDYHAWSGTILPIV